MSSKVSKLLAIRGRILGDLNHHIEEIDKFTDQTVDTAINFRSIAFEKSYKEFVNLLEELDRTQSYHEAENINDIIAKNRFMQDKYLLTKLKIAELIPDTSLNSTFYDAEPREFDERSKPTSAQYSSGMKLPELRLMPFTGKFEEWPAFKDMFLSVMKKYQGDDAEKLSHLKSYLKEEAYEVIQHLSIQNGNYEVALDLLTKTFENANAIVDSHLRNLFGIPTITENSANSIRHAITTTNGCLAGIKKLDILTDTWDPIMVYMLREKLSPELRAKWEEKRRGSFEVSDLKTFINFLEIRKKIADSLPQTKVHTSTPESRSAKPKVRTHVAQANKEDTKAVTPSTSPRKEVCLVCKEEHRIFKCPKLNQNASDAYQIIKELKLCENCLYNHSTNECKSIYTCKTCKQKHHTLLHEVFAQNTNHATVHYVTNDKRTLLATASIPIQTPTGEMCLRALIDQGSTINLITERGAQLLKCSRRRVNIPLYGIGDTKTNTLKYTTHFVIGSIHDKTFKMPIEALITQHITSIRPMDTQILDRYDHLKNLQFAEPANSTLRNIDLLIGANTLAELLCPGVIKGNPCEPVAQRTKIGWIISGEILNIPEQHVHVAYNDDDDQLSEQLKLFWVIEELNETPHLSKEELECENYFMDTIQRADDGKLIVRLPFIKSKDESDFLGESLDMARKRFFQLERRFEKDTKLRDEYTKCINEYIDLKHATLIRGSKLAFYVIPHHAVLKEDSLTTKLRTVFDASAKTTNGYSLNERMHVGPTIITDLWKVLIGWRLNQFAVTSDIEKMYRQFWIHPDDSQYQQIVWRDSQNEPLKRYELKTVTFGTKAAPFLAIRCLHYIADSVKNQKPELSQIIKEAFYVDDLLASFDSINEAKKMKDDLSSLFAEYGLNLRKWNSNNSTIISNETMETVSLQVHPSDTCNTLGMQWNTKNDTISFKVSAKPDKEKVTKRSILSEIASLFDPLGLLAPIIIRTKIFMQALWLGTYGWDDELPVEILNEWVQIKTDIVKCNAITINRWSGYTKNHSHISIHGFADASEKAYAAVVYLRTQHNDDTIHVQLIVSKTKVAPLKTVSIPRLELCAAVLLSNLIHKVGKTLKIETNEIFTWTDSAFTLAWISTPPYKLKTFVANRVAEIQEKTCCEKWRYIQTKLNPADHASRGLSTNHLLQCEQWWEGPKFLRESIDKWPKTPANMLSIKTIPEMRAKAMHQHEKTHEENEILAKYSSYHRLLHITAYCMRWLKRNAEWRRSAILRTDELISARNVWLRVVQREYYASEIMNLENDKPIHKRSTLLTLSPFLDKNKILRVRGRLMYAQKTDEAKHPAILPAKGPLTRLIIRQAHFRAFHGSTQLTLRTIRDEFWIIRGRVAVKNQVSKCIACFRYGGSSLSQQMSNLKPAQVQPGRPFSHSGVDYAGYFEVKISTRKNASFQKCYICLFICLTTKAIHLELAQDLSTNAFIAAFRRFVGRRGIPNHMYSDRGTNFIGASNELPSLWFDEKTMESQTIQKEYARQDVIWHFNPARASHFGGLWEAGVKSVKRHLQRTFGETRFTFEGFNTILIQIEACLNSRPLYPISNDQDDMEVLTPGHFLIGQPLMTLPHPDVSHIPMNRLTRYQAYQRITQDFWDKWSNEYLTQLQPRKKWTTAQTNVRVGQIVLIKEDNLKPSQWLMGRITRTFPGKDQLVRSVEVEHITRDAELTCRRSTVTRPIHKLCLLPIEDNIENLI